jgi:hypothetical protein
VNTALITACDDQDDVLEKTRTIDDHDAIWSAVVNWLMLQHVACVKVQRYDSTDTLVQAYTVTLNAVA